ncbi:tetratricopeptide repeat protein [Desulfovibrio sp. OttesenSCG-928-C14]|nr:tetratricopeptide repeat protein [Desulfovibrio sp. OttesenSCG-928-C14]
MGHASSAQPGPAAAARQSTASPAQAGRTSQESGPAQPAQSGGKPAWQSFSVKEPTAYPSSSSPAKSNEEIEEDFRTSFSLALVRLKSDPLQALADLDELASDNGPFAQEHKFMFTDCGLALRKRNHLALAMRFHQKARLLSPDDEHILFNMARVMYENGQIDKAREYLALSLEMEPGFTAGREFLEFLK